MHASGGVNHNGRSNSWKVDFKKINYLLRRHVLLYISLYVDAPSSFDYIFAT